MDSDLAKFFHPYDKNTISNLNPNIYIRYQVTLFVEIYDAKYFLDLKSIFRVTRLNKIFKYATSL